MPDLTEEELNEYVENIGIEYRFGCYKENNPESCHLLGEYMYTVTRDYKKAVKLFQETCVEKNFPESCFKYGFCLLKGRGVEKDVEKSREFFEKGCLLDESNSCEVAGELYNADRPGDLNQYKLAPNIDKAIKYLEQACSHNKGQSCFTLSTIFIKGCDKYPQDMEKAFKLSVKGCETGNAFSCANVSLMYKKGEGVAKNLEKSHVYSERAAEMFSVAANHKKINSVKKASDK